MSARQPTRGLTKAPENFTVWCRSHLEIPNPNICTRREETTSMRTRWQQFSAWGMVVLVVMILVGCAAMMGRQSPGGAVSDSTITTKVKTSFLGDPVVSAMAIDVDTNDGVVVL